MDTLIFHRLNSLVGTQGIFNDVVIFFASPFAYLLMFVVVFAFIFPGYFTSVIREKKLRIGILIGVVSAFLGRYVVKTLIVHFYNSPRPFDVLDGVNQIVMQSSMESFPSGHAIFFFTLSTVLVLYNKRLGVFLFVSSVLISTARVMAGIHWPSDVLAGASLGIITGLIFYSVLVLYAFSKLKIEEKIKLRK